MRIGQKDTKSPSKKQGFKNKHLRRYKQHQMPNSESAAQAFIHELVGKT